MTGDLEVFAEARAAELHMAEVTAPFAQRGDLLLMDTDSGPALGVVSLNGAEGLFKALRGGFISVSLTDVRRAWRVG